MLLVPNPILPQVTPTRPTVPTGGTTITVGNGKDYAATQAGLQAAMNAASPGDIIEIDAGSVITISDPGLEMPIKTNPGNDFIWVRPSAHAAFTAGVRAGAADTANMYTLSHTGTSGHLISPKFLESSGQMAHHWVWEGLHGQGTHTSSVWYVMITCGRDQTFTNGASSQSWEPHDIYLLHSYVHGEDAYSTRVGFEMNSRRNGVWDSTLVNFHDSTGDTQAVGGTTGTGGFVIDNCALQAAGEVIMFGGGAQQISGVNLSDITIRRSDFSWPSAWDGLTYNLKNLLEFKIGQRVLVEGNTFHNCWINIEGNTQNGRCLVIKENAEASWTRVKDLTFRNNKLYDAAGVADLLTVQTDFGDQSNHVGLSDILFANNVGWNLNREAGTVASAYSGNLFSMTPSNAISQVMRRVQIRRNTFLHDDFGQSIGTGIAAFELGQKNAPYSCDHWYVRDNVMTLWGAADTIRYGILTQDPLKSQQDNQAALEYAMPSYDVRGNLWIGNYTEAYFPSGNTKALNYAAAMFADWAGGDLRLAAGSPGLTSAVNGGPSGANLDVVDAATAGCLSGDWT